MRTEERSSAFRLSGENIPNTHAALSEALATLLAAAEVSVTTVLTEVSVAVAVAVSVAVAVAEGRETVTPAAAHCRYKRRDQSGSRDF